MRKFNITQNYKLITMHFLIICFLMLYSCDNSTGPVENNDIVPQTDIPWPSLADSPWPMHHHDPQSTGRSKYRGPQNGKIKSRLEYGMGYSSLSIGYNKLFFIGTAYPPPTFYAYDYEGITRWTSSFICNTTPLISSDSIIYSMGGWDMFGFSNRGDTVVKRILDTRMVSIGINIDKEGNLYYVDYNKTLVVRDKKGNKLWELKDERLLNIASIAPFSPDGHTIYLQGNSVSLLAIDIVNKIIKWSHGDIPLYSSPVIDNEGNLYFLPTKHGGIPQQRVIHSIDKNGQVNWKYNMGSGFTEPNTEPTIDYNGNVYFATDTVYSFTNGGKLRWKKFLDGFVNNSPIICDINNTIYLGLTSKTIQANRILAILDNGEINWEVIDTQVRAFGPGPALTENGLLIYPPWNDVFGKIIIIE